MPRVKFNYHVPMKRYPKYVTPTVMYKSDLTMSGHISAGNLNNSLNNGVDAQE